MMEKNNENKHIRNFQRWVRAILVTVLLLLGGMLITAGSVYAYTVQFDGNGNTGGSMSNKTYVLGAKNTLPANAFTKTGYHFGGWWVDMYYNTTSTMLQDYASGPKAVYKLQTFLGMTGANADGSYGQGTKTKVQAWQTSHGLTADGQAGPATLKAMGMAAHFADQGTIYGVWTVDTITVLLRAIWIPNTYTVKYNGNGNTGGSTASSSHTYDVYKTLTANGFTRTGYAFNGWNTNASGTGTNYSNQANVVNLTSTNGGTVNLYAKWKANTYTITFNKQSGTGGSDSVTATYDAAMPSATMPTRTGYTFGGYYTATGGGGTQYYTAAGASARTWNLTSATKLYAKWTANVYKVTLNNQSATTAGTTQYYIKYNTGNYSNQGATTSITSITKPAKTFKVTFNGNGGTAAQTSLNGTYTFGGYYTQTGGNGNQHIKADGTFASASPTFTTSDTTLYAKWTGGSVTLPAATRTGYTFNGWYTAASGGTKVGNAGATYTPTATTTLYAQWTPNIYTITLNQNGATTNGTGTIYEKYASGWYSNSGATTAITKVTVPQRKYTVTFNAHGGVAVANKTATYTFKGFYNNGTTGTTQYIDSTGKITAANNTFAENKTIYAQWTSASVNLGSTTRTGYTFNGWYTAATGGTKLSTTYTPTADITVHAQWTANTYTVTLDPNMTAGTLTNAGTDKIYETYDTKYSLTSNGAAMTTSSNKITVPKRQYSVTYNLQGGYMPGDTVVRPAYTFEGYYTETAFTNQYINKNGYITTTAQTNKFSNNSGKLYAKWSGGSTTLPTPKRLGYKFLGWAETANGTVVGAAGASYSPTKDVTLYAKWQEAYYNVKFNPNGATGSAVTQQIQSDIPTALRANSFTRPGYTFVGWATSPTGNVVYTNRTSVTNIAATDATINLYAIWQENAEILFVDDDTGEAPLIYKSEDNLGKYLIIESKSSNGYIMDGTEAEITNIDTSRNPGTFDLNGTTVNVELDATGTNRLANVAFTNTPNEYTIEKVNENGALLANFDTYGEWKSGDSAQFKFTVDGVAANAVIATYKMTTVTRDITGGNPNTGNITRTTTSEGVLRNGGTVTVDSLGYIHLQRLCPGTWHAVETRAHAGMTLNPTPITFTVDEDGYFGGVHDASGMSASVRVTNTQSGMYITKFSKGGVPVAGINFEVRQGSTTANATIYTTDAYGMIDLSALVNAAANGTTFYIKEADAANQTNLPEGMVISDTTQHTVRVTKSGSVTNVSVDGAAATRLGQLTIYNDVNRFTIQKVDTDTRAPLAGASFKLWNDSGDVYENLITGADGYIPTQTGLKSGIWYIQETYAPGGKLLDPTVYSFTVDATTHLISYNE